MSYQPPRQYTHQTAPRRNYAASPVRSSTDSSVFGPGSPVGSSMAAAGYYGSGLIVSSGGSDSSDTASPVNGPLGDRHDLARRGYSSSSSSGDDGGVFPGPHLVPSDTDSDEGEENNNYSSSESSESDGDDGYDKGKDTDSIGSNVSRAPAKRRRRDHRNGASKNRSGDGEGDEVNGKKKRGSLLSFRRLFFNRSDRQQEMRARARRQAQIDMYAARQRELDSSPDGRYTTSSTDSDESDSDSLPEISDAAMSDLFYDAPGGEFRNDADYIANRAIRRAQADDDDDDDDYDDDGNLRPARRRNVTFKPTTSSPNKRDHKVKFDNYVTGTPEDGAGLTRSRSNTPTSETDSAVASTAASGRSGRFAEGVYEDTGATKRSRWQLFWDQFFANSERMLMERKRSLLISISEIIIPVLFLVVTLIAGIALKTFSYDEMQPLDYNNPVVVPLMKNPERRFMCADPTAVRSDGRTDVPLVPGLMPCDAAGFDSVSCEGDDTSLPVRGLCYMGSMTGREVVIAYMGQLMGNLSYVPDFDTIVLYHWLARKSMGSEEDAVQQTLAAAGFISNTVASVVLRSGSLHFAPDSAETQSLVEYLNTSTMTFQYVYGQTFATNDDARDYVANGEGLTWGIINVKSLTETNFDVEIQVNRTALPKLTDRIDPLYSGGFQIGRAELYFASGFLTLQKAIYTYYTDHVAKISELSEAASGFVPYFLTMGSVPYKQSQMLLSASFIISFITTLAFLYPVAMLSKRVVQEKELRLEEAMSIMGMGQLPRALSTIVFNFLQFLLLSALLAMIVKCGFQSQSDFYIIFLVFLIYSLDCIALGLSSPPSSARPVSSCW